MTQPPSPEGADRRRFTRHTVNLRKSIMTAAGPTPVMDISWGGVCFFSTTPQEPGTDIEFTVGDLNVNACVLACDPAKGNNANEEFPYRVRCAFNSEPDDTSIAALMEYVLDEAGIGDLHAQELDSLHPGEKLNPHDIQWTDHSEDEK